MCYKSFLRRGELRRDLMRTCFGCVFALVVILLPTLLSAAPIQALNLALHERSRESRFDRIGAFRHVIRVTGDLILDVRFEDAGSILVVEEAGRDIVVSGTYESDHWQPAAFSFEEVEEGKIRIEYVPPFRFDSRSHQLRLGRPLRYADLVEISRDSEEVEHFPEEGRVVVGGFFSIHGDVVSLGGGVRVGGLSAKTHLTLGIPKGAMKALKIDTKSSELEIRGFREYQTTSVDNGIVLLRPDVGASCPQELTKSQLFEF